MERERGGGGGRDRQTDRQTDSTEMIQGYPADTAREL